MKSILSILKVFCTLLVVSVFVDFIKRLHKIFYYLFNGGERSLVFNMQIPGNWPDGVYNLLSITSLILIIYMVLLMVDFRQVIFNFSKNEVFTEENSNQLRRVGRGGIIYGVIMFLFYVLLGILINKPSPGYDLGRLIGGAVNKVLSVFVMALFVQFISFIVVKGNVLKEENDLTI
ncbi:DUF2975 domain-containing protein [Tenacibaculum sp. SDUM215027]|uniref:DUF2975 domain-containing protein n=1 Tax=Tenacibaculum sp. SDUM215027 TaxID=3422596 RepID=UPI003D3155AB